MHICLIMDNPETPYHPVIAPALQELSATHTVRLLDVRALSGAEALEAEAQYPRADLYLLKSHAPQALELAHALEEQGAMVVNSWASSVACQDRVLMAQRMEAAGLPWPRTHSFATLGELLADEAYLAAMAFPVILKSHFSHRGDVVAFVRSREQLQALGEQWSQEPIVLQEYAQSDGWDIKLWVIDQHLYAARRRTPLEPDAPKEDYPIAPDELPTEWATITREIGRVFNMRLYGVDLLNTERGPVIVDVNGFPGFRGVPGADQALVGLVERIGQERNASEQKGQSEQNDDHVTIVDLPAVVADLFERAHRPLLPDSDKAAGLFVRYLRRKPARGLAVIYAVDALGRSHNGHVHDPHRSVSLTLDEKALEGARILFSKTEAQSAALEVQPSGVLRAEALGLSAQAFPADDGLPALAASCDVGNGGPVFEALQQAARAQWWDDAWQLVKASAEAVRYKPASRCVIRYTLTLEHGQDENSTARQLTVFGKVYADPQQASSVQALQQQLYDEQVSILRSNAAEHGYHAPLLPRPLNIMADIGLTFNEAVQPANAHERMLTGTRAIRPAIERGRGGEISSITIPDEELRLTAVALARLHTSAVRPKADAPRTGAKEAKRARERASLIASHNPAQADEVARLAKQLSDCLETLQPDEYRPAHGGFKSSQLLFHSHQVFVVDFDGFCLADSALDVGYFLAYLRPSGLWYGNAGTREWFEAAAALFVASYRQAMLDSSTSQDAIDGIIARSRLYEAALIFKVATRRANRLNSPRTKELSSMLSEIAACLSDAVKR